ncbi:pyridoxamine 5'-phosphate oxidase family protein [Streptacidiphilus neutrinimicus]|uniref:pyridoxamine 5'-phosphate oxidase family protein n=1 Tax=Streptacidiphilus neutrinimicus TaxID=105420 RepID=UPI000A011FB0|nr:pyridoxamine 5'-phosphate oxidase family protein [Streptacidiphilus neutrinimicus]
MTALDSLSADVLDVLDAYRTCEFATLGRDGTPIAWPTAARRREDGTLLVTTSVAFAQKALNVRRDGRVALLFSEPTGSGHDAPPQIVVTGRAVCSDDVTGSPRGAEEYWRTLFERQPHSRAYVRRPVRSLMDWYYLRLLITVTPEQAAVRSPLPPTFKPPRGTAAAGLVGAEQLAQYPTAVLAARDSTGAPVLARTRPAPAPAGDGFTLRLPDDCPAVPGPASLLVHRHDERLNGMHNAVVRGVLRATGDGWALAPQRVVEPIGTGSPGDALRVLRQVRGATRRYFDRRGLERPRVHWDEFRSLAAPSRRPGGAPGSGDITTSRPEL